MSVKKHFVDTSVVRPLISPSTKAKEYYKNQLSGRRYISEYVKMEYVRGFIVPLMQFHAKLSMPNSNGISDALKLWSHRFQPRQIKSVMALMGSLVESVSKSGLTAKLFEDKEFQVKYVGDYIRRLSTKIDTAFSKIGTDSNLCHRSTFHLNYNAVDINESFRIFFEEFCDIRNSDNCTLKKFLIKNQEKIIAIIAEGTVIQGVPITGFSSVRDSLKKIIGDPNKLATCTNCSKIGDAIIALQSPEESTLEHVDNSFNYLAKILQKPHRQHPSEAKINN